MLPPLNLIDTASGKFLLFATRDLISSQLYSNGTWEPFTVETAKRLLAPWQSSNGIVIDAGANLGAFAIPLARALPADMVMHCFEIQRVVFYQLCGNVLVNRLANVYPHHVGLGARSEWLDVPVPNYMTDENLGGLSASEEVRGLRQAHATDAGDHAMEKVQIRTLDSLEFAGVRLLKIDVEGMEWDVLRGATETLTRSAFPPLLLEIWNKAKRPALAGHVDRLLGYLSELGYGLQILGDLCIAQFRGRPFLKIAVDMEKKTVAYAWADPA